MRRLKKALQLPPAELWLLMEAVICLPIVRVALRFHSVASLHAVRARSRQQSTKANTNTPSIKAEEIARLVQLAAQHGICRPTCLEQSMVLRWLLVRRGIDGRIVFGTRKAAGEMQAHAWVEVHGVPLIGDKGADADFKRFEQLAPSIYLIMIVSAAFIGRLGFK